MENPLFAFWKLQIIGIYVTLTAGIRNTRCTELDSIGRDAAIDAGIIRC